MARARRRSLGRHAGRDAFAVEVMTWALKPPSSGRTILCGCHWVVAAFWIAPVRPLSDVDGPRSGGAIYKRHTFPMSSGNLVVGEIGSGVTHIDCISPAYSREMLR